MSSRVENEFEDRAALIDVLRRHEHSFIAGYLRRVWDGSDRGELKELLVEAWGPSTKSAADLRGLAARESQPGEREGET